jgi:hypothetical protein
VNPYDATLQAQIDEWHCAGDVAQTAMTDVANRAKDAADEALDAQRVHGGQTLSEFFEGTK